MTLNSLLLVAHGLLATTYGFGEMNCGDINAPHKCDKSAITASGIAFDPDIAFVAIAAPTEFNLKPTLVYLKTRTGKCHPIVIIDKMNPRYIGIRGFDVSPAGVKLLTGKEPRPDWSEPLYLCSIKSKKPVKSKSKHR